MVGKLTPDDIVTASRVPVLLGLSPYKTPNELLKEAIEAAAGKPPSRLPQTEQMRLGDLLEGPILMEAAYRLDLDEIITNIDEAFETAALAMRAGIDWLEVGTPLILAEGLHGVQKTAPPTVACLPFSEIQR